MPKTMIAKVFTDYEDGEYGPDYAMIRLAPEAVAPLREKLAAVEEIAARFRPEGFTPGTGPVQAVKFWLCDTGLEVTWLRYGALYDEDEPEWLAKLEDESFVVLDEFEPILGEEDEYGRPENEFTAVDLEYVGLMPDRKFEVTANVDSGGYPFSTMEAPLDVLLD